MALPPFTGFQPFLRNNSDNLLSIGLGLLSGKTAQEQVGQAAANFANERTLNRTAQYLKSVSPELGAAIENKLISPGDAYKLFYQQKLEAQKPKNNFMSAGGSLYNTETGQWITPPANQSADQETFYGNPIPIQTPNGIQYGQIGSKGSFKPINIGEGNTFAPTVKTVDAGTETVLIGPGGVPVAAPIQKDVAGAAREAKIGGAQGDAAATYQSMSSKLPGLLSVVDKLDALADKATYTAAGQVLDIGRKQLGMEPRESAIARAEYIATVDNQVLPLLRDTFGAQFTQKEGETLRATLGDPDKSPQEKKAVLHSFIEQKKRDLEALAAQSGQGPAPAAGGAGNTTSSGIGWSIEP